MKYMKKLVLIITMALTPALSLMAQVVSRQEVMKAANNTFPVYEGMPQSLDKASIQSAEYAVEPVIAYNNSGKIDPDDLPPACGEWLENVGKQIEYVRKNEIEAAPGIRERWEALLSEEAADQTDKKQFSPWILPERSSRSVEPLITTQWGQRTPYNLFCPVDPASPDSHAVTGCKDHRYTCDCRAPAARLDRYCSPFQVLYPW